MFIIERFIVSQVVQEELVENTWIQASKHTASNDRDVQKQRFLDSGIAEEDLRYTEE